LPYANKEQHKEWVKRRRLEIRRIIQEAKDVPCSDCDVSYPTCVMTFDHVKGIKKFHIGEATAKAKSIKALLEEIDKCEVVCHNCHAIRTETRKLSGMDEDTALKAAAG